MKTLPLIFRSLAVVALLGVGAVRDCFSEPLEVGALDLPPFFNVDESKVVSGFWYETIETLLTRAGIEHAFKVYPPKRYYANIGNGTIKIWAGPIGGMSNVHENFLVSPKPISEMNIEVFTMGPVDSLPKSVEGLKNSSVITLFGYNYGGLIGQLIDPALNIKVLTANTHEAAFKMLHTGRANFLIDYRVPAAHALNSLGYANVNKRDLKTIPVFIMVSKALPDAQVIMNKIMSAYTEAPGR